MRQRGAERSCCDDLHDGAGDRDAPHRQKLGKGEMQAHAEHQQHHADLGQLLGQMGVGDEPRRERPDRDAGQQIADDG